MIKLHYHVGTLANERKLPISRILPYSMFGLSSLSSFASTTFSVFLWISKHWGRWELHCCNASGTSITWTKPWDMLYCANSLHSMVFNFCFKVGSSYFCTGICKYLVRRKSLIGIDIFIKTFVQSLVLFVSFAKYSIYCPKSIASIYSIRLIVYYCCIKWSLSKKFKRLMIFVVNFLE